MEEVGIYLLAVVGLLDGITLMSIILDLGCILVIFASFYGASLPIQSVTLLQMILSMEEPEQLSP